MWPDGIIIVAPAGQLSPGISRGLRHLLVQEFVAKARVECLDEGILGRFAGSDVMPSNTDRVLPFQNGAAGQSGAVVADNGAGLAVKSVQGVEFAGHTYAGDRRVGNQAETLAR